MMLFSIPPLKWLLPEPLWYITVWVFNIPRKIIYLFHWAYSPRPAIIVIHSSRAWVHINLCPSMAVVWQSILKDSNLFKCDTSSAVRGQLGGMTSTMDKVPGWPGINSSSWSSKFSDKKLAIRCSSSYSSQSIPYSSAFLISSSSTWAGTNAADKPLAPLVIMPKKKSSRGLWSCYPLSCILCVFQTCLHICASVWICGVKRWCSSQIWEGSVGIRPWNNSRSSKKFFHFRPNPWFKSYQHRSIRMLCTLL